MTFSNLKIINNNVYHSSRIEYHRIEIFKIKGSFLDIYIPSTYYVEQHLQLNSSIFSWESFQKVTLHVSRIGGRGAGMFARKLYNFFKAIQILIF